MKAVFRTDSSLQIGSGHVMRCITLADELQRRGADVLFICREHEGNLNGLLEQRGFQVARLSAPEKPFFSRPEDAGHAPWLGVSWEEDAEDTLRAMDGLSPEWLIVDHYALHRFWEEKLRTHVGKIMIIDDLADRAHDCDLLVDQNLYDSMESRYAGLVPDSCREFLGPKFALLRPEFVHARKGLRPRDGQVNRILVFFGGIDSTMETEKTLDALAGIRERSFDVDVIVGGGNPRKDHIQQLCSTLEGIRFHCQVENMAELMSNADLAIGAGGTTSWERCALGLPALVTSVAENQVELAKCGAIHGLFFYLGDCNSVDPERVRQAILLFADSPSSLEGFSRNGLAAVDGKGVQRIGGYLAPPKITVRLAQQEDCDSVFEWRNAEETRRYIFDSAPIPYETHRKWFQRTLGNPDRVLLIGEEGGKPVGVLRYDLNGEEALISVYLVPGGQGQGVGTELIRCGSRWLKAHKTQINVINAEILRVNVGSLRAFEQAGYREHHSVYREVLR